MYQYRVKEVVRVVDGDTVDIVLDLGFDILKKERVRIAGIDTPEKRTRNAREKLLGLDATAYTEAWFSEGEIVIHTEKEGKYGRMIGWCYKEEECFNHLIVEEGYAMPYDGGTKIDMNDPDTLLTLLNRRGYTDWEDYTEANS